MYNQKEVNEWVRYIFDDEKPMQCSKEVKKRAKEFANNYQKYTLMKKYTSKFCRKIPSRTEKKLQLSRRSNEYAYNYRLFSMV